MKKDKDGELHKGHRQRVREKYEKSGSESFKDHELLELVLFHAIPYRDTNPIAHRLLDTFGSLGGVFSAKIDALCAVEGVVPANGGHFCQNLSLYMARGLYEPFPRHYVSSKHRRGVQCLLGSNIQSEETEERSVMLCLDASLRAIRYC